LAVGKPKKREAISVALLRPLPHARNPAMRRFGPTLQKALATIGGVAPRSFPERPRPLGRGLRGGYTRLIVYPRKVFKAQAEVFHITDQGYAHAARVLPYARSIVTCHDLMAVAASARELQFRFPRRTRLRYRLVLPHLARVAQVACVSETARRDAIELAGVDLERCTGGDGLRHARRRLGLRGRGRDERRRSATCPRGGPRRPCRGGRTGVALAADRSPPSRSRRAARARVQLVLRSARLRSPL